MSGSILQKYICVSGEGGDGAVEVALSSPSLHSRDIVKLGQELLEVHPSSASTKPNCCCKKVNSEQGQVPPQHIERVGTCPMQFFDSSWSLPEIGLLGYQRIRQITPVSKETEDFE